MPLRREASSHTFYHQRNYLILIMPSMLVKNFIFLAFNFLAIAHPQGKARVPVWTLGTVDDWVSTGDYRIYSCSFQALRVKLLLDTTYTWIKTASLSLGTPAYEAFFGSKNQRYVRNLFECITEGYKVNGSPPTLVCVNEADLGISHYWNRCKEERGIAIITPHNTTDLLLCPQFFELDIGPQHERCGTVNNANTELNPHGWILGTQYGFLIEALADLYLPIAMPKTPLDGSVNEENACMELPPDEAVRNPSNYGYFTSSKLSLHSIQVCFTPFNEKGVLKGSIIKDIRAGCTEFPTKHRDREMTEVNVANASNGTNLVTLGCFGSKANSSSCSE